MGVKTLWSGKRRLRFTYMSSGGEVTERTVIAQRIVREGSFFRLTGYCLLREDQREFRLDRIQGDVTDTETGEFGPLSKLCPFDATPSQRPQPPVPATTKSPPGKIKLKNPRKKPPYGLPLVPSTRDLRVEDITDYKELFDEILEPGEIRDMALADLLRHLDGFIELDVEDYTDFVTEILEGDLPNGISGNHIVTIDPDVDPVYFLAMRSDPALKSPLIIDCDFPNVDDLVGFFGAAKLKEWATRSGLKASGKKQEIAEALVSAGVDVGFRRCRINPDAALEHHGLLSQRYIHEISAIANELPSVYRQALWSEVTLQHALTDHALEQAKEALATLEAETPKEFSPAPTRSAAAPPKQQPIPRNHEPQTDFSHGHRYRSSTPEPNGGLIAWLSRLFGKPR